MSDVLTRFGSYFGRRTPEEIEQQETRHEEAKDNLRRIQQAGPFIKDFKDRLHGMAEKAKWEPGMTQEQAAQNLIAQTIYLEIIRDLDRMMRAATEHVDG